MTEFEKAHDVISELAKTFGAHESKYLSPNYQEVELRKDFIDKFWKALGWDVDHDIQKNPYEQEVKVERGQQQGAARKRADYAFSVAPNFRDVRFFVEAKKPSGELENADDYFQATRYGWNSQNPLAVLTDFEQFHILDCRYKPNVDTALTRALPEGKFHYTEYLDAEKFARIYWLFSREAVVAGSIEKFAAGMPQPRGRAVQRGLFPGGYQSIDESFLDELDEIRADLARAFKKTNADLGGEDLTEIVQRTIDRLVFIRFLEDRLIESQYLVATFGEKSTAWEDFIAASRKLDGVYNGIVFKRHARLDDRHFAPDDALFSAICEDISHINSPYDFNAIPIHILGSIYERFLGKVIVATDKRARVEEKPEVRKAGGVYYTPEYIVRYIVENTVGKLIEGKSPAQIAEMKFGDIACGSGSFLLGVYDLLIRYHTKFYNDNPAKPKRGEVMERDDGLHLTLQKKRAILLNNIFGVDIDMQAVEVAQLSLYLKLLQDETPGSARAHQLEFHETLLPPLNNNITCGNSLIGTDILSGELFEPVEERKLNPMDFEQRFPEIMKRGGFDAVLGNPPYVNAWDFFERQPVARQFINDKSHYETADRHWDLYVLFLERAYQITKRSGRFSFIIPFSYSIQKYGILSRKFLLEKTTIESIADIRTVRVFGDVPVITIIPVFVKEQPSKNSQISVLKPSELSTKTKVESFQSSHTLQQRQMLAQHEHMLRLDLSTAATKLVERMDGASIKLGELCYVNYGAQMSSKAKGGFGKEHVIRDHKTNKHCKKMIGGRELYRYTVNWEGRYVDWAFAPQMYGARWPEFFELPKIMIRDITGTHRVEATFDTEGFYCDHSVLCALRKCDVAKWKEAAPSEIALSEQFHLAFLTGLVASKCVSTYFYLVLTGEGVRTGGGFHTYPETIRNFPIPKIDFSTPADKTRHDKIVSLVDQMLSAKKQLAAAQSDKDKDFYENKCAALDRQIDALVYELYGMTEEEIAVVEGA